MSRRYPSTHPLSLGFCYLNRQRWYPSRRLGFRILHPLAAANPHAASIAYGLIPTEARSHVVLSSVIFVFLGHQ